MSGLSVSRLGGRGNSRHRGLQVLGHFGQPHRFPEQSLEVLSFYFRQDPGSLPVAFALGLCVSGPVQRGSNTWRVAKRLVSQGADLLRGRGRPSRIDHEFLQVALERYDCVEFLPDGFYERPGRANH